MTSILSIMRRTFAVLAMSAVLSSCGGGPAPIAQSPGVEIAPASGLPAPTRQDRANSSREYLIGPYDKLAIDVFGVEALQREVQVDANGDVSFPLAGTIQAGGITPGELARAIEGRLRGEYVRDPQVTVNLVETVSQQVTVDGQVKQPGIYPVVGNMTLMRAVATAGGTTEYAQLKDVVVFREVGGQQYIGLYNLEGIRRGNYPDPEIYSSDIVMVGDSAARRRFETIIEGSSLIFTPLILLSRL